MHIRVQGDKNIPFRILHGTRKLDGEHDNLIKDHVRDHDEKGSESQEVAFSQKLRSSRTNISNTT